VPSPCLEVGEAVEAEVEVPYSEEEEEEEVEVEVASYSQAVAYHRMGKTDDFQEIACHKMDNT
jgi:hypothetical protein